MPAALADPPAAPESAVNGRALPELPADLAAAFDAEGELCVRHPKTGRRLRLIPDFDGAAHQTTLLEDVEAAQAEYAAGKGVPWEEHLADRPRHLAELLLRNGFDPADHIPAEALAGVDLEGLKKSLGR